MISDSVLDDIISIKSSSWKYSKQEHTKWIAENINSDDLHFLYYEADVLIGYMNLVHVILVTENGPVGCLGIGNVCTKFKGNGDGKNLMKELNEYLSHTTTIGLLFCKNNLVNFYLKYGWNLIVNLHPNTQINTMIYNFSGKKENLVYNDRLF